VREADNLTATCQPINLGNTGSSTYIPVILMTASTRATRRNITEDGIFHSHCRENYEVGFYIPEDDIIHNHHYENLKFYIALTGWAL
jgi:hypothetical protein